MMASSAQPLAPFAAPGEDGVEEDEDDDAEEGSKASWLMGKKYARGGEKWQKAVDSVLWMTYRCGFPEMTPYGLTDDAGWGCMLRSAQMLMGNALLRHLDQHSAEPSRDTVIRWFADSPGEVAIYSIHNMIRCGMRYDMLPGEWYGPGVAAHVLRDLCEMHELELGGVKLSLVVTSPESPLCEEAICDALTADLRSSEEHINDDEEDEEEDEAPPHASYDPLLRPPPRPPREIRRQERVDCALLLRSERLESPWTRSLLVIVPLRLGLSSLEPRYLPPLVSVLRFPQSVGFVGGRPRQALFFAGTTTKDTTKDDYLVGYDPHTVQPCLGEGLLSVKHLESLRCSDPRLLPPSSLDPSLAIGFYCADRAAFVDLCARIRGLEALSSPPLFVVTKHKQRHMNDDDDAEDFDMPNDATTPADDELDDEYVVI